MQSIMTRITAAFTTLLMVLSFAGLPALSAKLCGIYKTAADGFAVSDSKGIAVLDSYEAWQAMTAQLPELAQTDLQVDAAFFETHNLAVFSVTFPQTNYEALFLPPVVRSGRLIVRCWELPTPEFGLFVFCERIYLAVCSRSVTSVEVVTLNGPSLEETV